jgi:hypothetical protein
MATVSPEFCQNLAGLNCILDGNEENLIKQEWCGCYIVDVTGCVT